MANREELALIRGARAGRAASQLELGKRYLFGSAGLPRNLPTALHWLARAAQQGCSLSCELIGAHIPFEVAVRSERPASAWFERAYDAGGLRAGLVLAQLTLAAASDAGGDAAAGPSPALQAKAMAALDKAARAGIAEAQWLLAERQRLAMPPAAVATEASTDVATAVATSVATSVAGNASWPRPASAPLSRQSALDQAWEAGHWRSFLEGAVPLALALLDGAGAPGRSATRLARADAMLLSRCAQALSATADQGAALGVDEALLRRFWETAAAEQDRHAQLAVGLWHARMQIDGTRISPGLGSANFKKAIRWLALAGEQGLAEAWYALSRIYIKPEFSQRNVHDAQRYLERAAEMGYRDAQLECGQNAWRARREHQHNDVRAVYWLQKAAAQGCVQAAAALARIAPRDAGLAFGAVLASCFGAADHSVMQRLRAAHPLLAARLELALQFGLSRAEALLLDLASCDQGHCLVVDIRGSYGRSKRRLVAVDGVAERRLLDRIRQLFEGIDSGPGGPEGNYRQRLYRLKTMLPQAAGEAEEVGELELAA